MKIMITGFDPFGGESVNPAYEAVKLLPDEIGGVEIVKLEIPTVFGKAGEALKAGVEEHQPDAVICVGQAGDVPACPLKKWPLILWMPEYRIMKTTSRLIRLLKKMAKMLILRRCR
ncbi:Pyrrolidone-carboxylate peptidase [Eubacterium plexicaudatum ASF492]|nr:Pyrrolidone-carboxylate peptidase [Eubacterium plexicaudatum ASF492]